MIDEISHDRLRRNLAHNEIRILDKNSKADFFVRHTWDGRVFLANSGGSHHFAAARLIAGELGDKVPLNGLLYTRYLDERVIRSEEHTSELQSHMRIPYAAFGFNKNHYVLTTQTILPTLVNY